MRTEVLKRFETNLPADDVHPYRSGPWRPQHTEWRAWDLDVTGEIPADLNGVYLRNTENPLHLPLATYHPFDGDGMVHSLHLADGEASYTNRFVRTKGLAAEIDSGGALWAGFVERPEDALRSDGWGARTRMKDASSTDVVVHGGVALTSFWQCGDLYRLDPITLETLGTESWNGAFPAEGVSAHTKLDEQTGELLFFNYSTEAPYMHYGVVGSDGALTHYIDVPLPGPRLTHDLAFTTNYTIINDCPLFWDPRALDGGLYVPRFFPDLPTRFGIVPRFGGTDEIRWFEADPTYVLHWINAFEDGDEVVVDGYFQHSPVPKVPTGAGIERIIYSHLDLYELRTEIRRWRFNLRTGATREETLTDRVCEFGVINPTIAGRSYRYAYSALPCEGWFGFRGLLKHDLVTGAETVVELPDGVYGSEAVMVPRSAPQPGAESEPGSRSEPGAEDDGYLLTYLIDTVNDRSSCLILDAAAPEDGPLATVSLPERISSGTHATWAPADALDRG
ncbi:MAG: carotenoid oxygenase family protein [Actinomycetota bacterium]